MQKKRNTKLKAIDFTIIILCLAGAVFSGVGFWREFNRTLSKLNEDPVATIIFKKRTAQRKFIDRGVWDRLKQTSPVYDGDTIRTIEQSEAIINFQDEVTYLSMDASTMIQVFYNERSGAKIDFSEGGLDVASDSKNLVITSGTSTIVLDGKARLNKNEEEFVLAVFDGEASFNGNEIEAGNILALDSNGDISTKPVISMTSFGPSAYVLGAPSRSAQPSNSSTASQGSVLAEPVVVVFSWNELNFNSDTSVIVEVATDRRFNHIVQTRNVSGSSSVAVPLTNGSYWWRAYPVSGDSRTPESSIYPSGTLEVIPAAAAILTSPAHAQEYVFADRTLVPLSWTAVESAAAYLLEISANEDMSAPAVSRQVQEISVSQSGLDFGRWYWRITPVFSSQITGTAPSSALGEFSLVRDEPAPVPDTLPPIVFGTYTGNWEDLDAQTIAENERILRLAVRTLNTRSEYRLRIEGHANSTIDPDDTASRLIEQTQELIPMSEARARTVADRLVSLGADRNRLDVIGLGGEHPVAAWEDADNWWKNRRVEIVVVK